MALDNEQDEKNRQEYEARNVKVVNETLAKASLEKDRIFQVLIAAGHITQAHIDKAREVVLMAEKLS